MEKITCLIFFPVALFEAFEDDACICIFGVVVAPDIKIAVRVVGVFARFDKSRMLVGGMVDGDVENHAQVALVRCLQKAAESILFLLAAG